MKIAFVSSGRSIHVKKLANALVNNGHDVTLFTLPNHTDLINQFNKKVKIIVLKFGGKIGYYLNVPTLRKKLITGKFDLINCHYISGYGTLTRLANVHPIVASVFGSDVYDYPYRSKQNMARIIKNLNSARIITSTSQVMVDKVQEYYKNRKPIYVTHFGIDTNLFKPLPVDSSESEKNAFVFGIVKKIEDKYGVGLLIEAFNEFIKNDSEKKCKLIIYGKGSKENEYIELVKKLNMQEYIHFRGYINNEKVPQVLHKINVVCLPSILDSESFGVAAVEAMACAKPLIVSNASGFTEVVDSSCAIIIPKNDKKALVDAMERCYQMEKNQLYEMGQNGYNRAVRMFDFSRNIETYINSLTKAVIDERN
ncbi:glycosyltransferase family 4 protein [Paenibacillus sp. HB172176]|uniref:glycosyltransferase family 4 protein n=1 Tax=Paenibacillus sp. HB172176 TaxID=2493690 RepID=UPI00143A61DA|nr:glycosyltransferase family 4 protein [Paenibacillus sp. HB172176]